jgi:hypothetical protein
VQWSGGAKGEKREKPERTKTAPCAPRRVGSKA